MDNLFLEEFIDAIDPKDIKEIKINEQNNVFQMNNDNIVGDIDDYDISTETIIHKQDNLSENNNKDKIYDISSLYTQELKTERLLISYTDIDTDKKYFNSSYEYQFNLNKTYKNVVGLILDTAIFEYSASETLSSPYLDVIINNIPREALINNLKGYNIIKRIHYDHTYDTNKGVGYASLYSKPNYFYPINLNKLNMELRYAEKPIDLLDSDFNTISDTKIGKFSFEFELTMLNR